MATTVGEAACPELSMHWVGQHTSSGMHAIFGKGCTNAVDLLPQMSVNGSRTGPCLESHLDLHFFALPLLHNMRLSCAFLPHPLLTVSISHLSC